MLVSVYRYNPETDREPYMQDVEVSVPEGKDLMVLDVLNLIKEKDQSLSYRRSCREGVCGSDSVNMNGKNGLACITPVSGGFSRQVGGSPSMGFQSFVISWSIWVYFISNISGLSHACRIRHRLEVGNTQSPEDRAKLDGLYECILCACCSTSCPSFWWNPEKFVGPSGLLQAYRFLADTG